MQVFLVVLKNARTLKATTLGGFSFKFAQWSRQYLAENNKKLRCMHSVDGRPPSLRAFWKKNWGLHNVPIINIPPNEEKLSLSILAHVKSEGGALCEPFVLVTIFGRTCGWLASWATISTWIREGFNGFKMRFWAAWLNSLWWWRYRTGKYGEQTTSKLLRFVVTQTFDGSPIA